MITAEMVERAVGKFGADIPWCKAVAEKLNAELSVQHGHQELLVKADSMLSYLHYRGMIQYDLPMRPVTKQEVCDLISALRRASQERAR